MEVVCDIDNVVSTHYAPLLHEITEKEFEDVYFCFEHREANFEAHTLAKLASNLPVGCHFWIEDHLYST